MALGNIRTFNKARAAQRVLFVLIAGVFVVQAFSTTSNQSADASPRPITSGFTNVATADDHTCAVRGGAAYCWGLNVAGGLGNGVTDDQEFEQYPVAVTATGALAGKTVTAVGVGYQYSCALTSDGAVYCWGDNSSGQLGNGTTNPSNVPVAVTMSGALAGKTVTSLSVTYHAACVIASDSNSYCWGTNQNGELGTGSMGGIQTTPQPVLTTGALLGLTIASISAGDGSTCAIASNQASYCWGRIETSPSPVKVNTGGSLVLMRNISVSGSNMCEIGLNAIIYCMGPNNFGQLGNGTTTDATVPTEIDSAALVNGQATGMVSVGSDATVCAQSFTGRIFCWGRNDSGGVAGDGVLGIALFSDEYSARPLAIDAFMNPDTGDNAQSIVNGGVGSKCSVTAAGAILCWGGTQGRGNGMEYNSIRRSDITYVSQPGPDISSIDTSSAYIGLGDVHAVIHGHDFDGTDTVKIGTTQVSVDSWTATTLNVTIPTDNVTPGTVGITVTNGDGLTGTQANAFTYQLYTPNVDSISPSQLRIDGASHTLTITGERFQNGVTVEIDDVAVPATRVSETELTVEVPTTGQTTHYADITVHNPNGQSIVFGQNLLFATFSIRGVSPNAVVSDGTQQSGVFGYFFQPGATVMLGDTPVNITYQDDQGIQFDVPARTVTTPQSVDVTVTNPDGTTAVLPNGFTFEPIPVTSITGVVFGTDTTTNTKTLTVTGHNLADIYSPSGALYSLGFVTVNGTPTPFCATNIGSDAAAVAANFGLPVDHVSDTPPCFLLVNSDYTIAVTDTQVKVFLPGNFDETAPLTVSVRGVSFGTSQTGDDTGDSSDSGSSSAGAGSSNSGVATQQKSTRSTQPVAIQTTGSNETTDTDESQTPVSTIVPSLLSNGKALRDSSVIAAKPTFSGVATPFSKITVTVHSDPITCTATANGAGMWTCTLPQTLPAGQHTVKVNVTAPDGTTSELGPYTVTVKGDTPTQLSGQVSKKPTFIFWLILIAAGLFVIAIIAAMIARSRRKSRDTSHN